MITEKILSRALEIEKYLTKENLCEFYARYSRLLEVECDDDNEEEHVLLKFLVDFLEDAIVEQYMNDHGYYYETEETYPYWAKENKEHIS